MDDWMIESWLLLSQCFLFFLNPMRTLHTVMSQKKPIFHVRDVLECKTWIPPTTLFLWLLFWKVVWWTEPFPALGLLFFLRHGGPCWLYPQITCLPCVTYNAHLLNVSSRFFGENSRTLNKHVYMWFICFSCVCACVNVNKFLNAALKFGSHVGVPVVDEVKGVLWIWTECTDCV